ncbi:copine-8-like isoform X2 [Anneissia japonica]|uniref:copine-8-like isoform X2 n=1 Tax=Anneissia japonica TaxID=1529436 RepID=UPI001425A9B1|nr:copine-8-like isoform X2 [Anneissia japonica]
MNSSGGGFQPGSATANPSTKVELTVSCRKLRDMDVFSKSDPFCVFYTVNPRTGQYQESGRTETIDNNLNPDFARKFVVDYFFEQHQPLKFDVYDADSKSNNLSSHDFIGSAQCTLGQIVGAQGSRLVKDLRSNQTKYGTIIITYEELSSCKDEAQMQFQGIKLAKKDLFGKSDPYLIFYRCNENMSFTVAYRTDVIKNTLNPVWKPFTVPLRTLCNADLDRTIKVECCDWNRDGSIDLIGEFKTNMRRFIEGSQTDNIYKLTKEKSKKKGKTYGTISLLSCRVQKMFSFLDYIQGGMELSFVVAIDFTASNGAPQAPNSLHHINPHIPNQYEQAIQSVGLIIQEYDTDKLFPVFGFGAKLPPDGRISHDFPVNFNYQNPFCGGVEGILGAYRNCIPQVQLHGPTNFAPIINRVARDASGFMNGSNFFVLLIITDGIISDMDFTKVAVINASKLPMAIIIVGVGNADFSAMEELDSDDSLLSHGSIVADHDIVQFVPFNEIVHRSGNRDMGAIQAQLAKEVLAEIPDQIVTWTKLHGIKPSTRPPPYCAVQSGSV